MDVDQLQESRKEDKIELSDDDLPEIDDISLPDSVSIDEDEDDIEAMILKTKIDIPIDDDIKPEIIDKPELVDDFVRNFLIKFKMFKTLEVFQAEWFELKSKGKLNEEDLSNVPDVYVKNETLHDLVKNLRNELDTAKSITEKTKDTWEKLRKERDFHKIHHRRVQQEKTKLSVDIDRLKKLHDTYEER